MNKFCPDLPQDLSKVSDDILIFAQDFYYLETKENDFSNIDLYNRICDELFKRGYFEEDENEI